MGKIKKTKHTVWTGHITSSSGKKIPRLMTDREAQGWSKKTGQSVWKAMKKYELDEL